MSLTKVLFIIGVKVWWLPVLILGGWFYVLVLTGFLSIYKNLFIVTARIKHISTPDSRGLR